YFTRVPRMVTQSADLLPLGVTGNTPDSGSGESWFDPRRGNLQPGNASVALPGFCVLGSRSARASMEASAPSRNRIGRSAASSDPLMQDIAVGTPYAGMTTATGSLAAHLGLIERGRSTLYVTMVEVRGSARKEWQH